MSFERHVRIDVQFLRGLAGELPVVGSFSAAWVEGFMLGAEFASTTLRPVASAEAARLLDEWSQCGSSEAR